MNDSELTGVLAALSAQFFMAVGFIIWDVTWKQSNGSAFALNLFKCNLASIIFLITASIFGYGTSELEFASNRDIGQSIGFLLLSGFIGIVVGDLLWLQALRLLGASNVFVIDTLKPFAATLLGYLILGENIQKVAFSGIVLTVVGILIVSLQQEMKSSDDNVEDENISAEEKKELKSTLRMNSKDWNASLKENDKIIQQDENASAFVGEVDEEAVSSVNIPIRTEVDPTRKVDVVPENMEVSRCSWNKQKGFFLAVANVFLDAYGSVLTKQHGQYFTSFTINLVRFGSSGIFMALLSVAMRLLGEKKDCESNTQSTKDAENQWYKLPNLSKRNWAKISFGVLFVTYICPLLSNYALFEIPLGLALTLGSITPLYGMILEWMIHGEEKKPTLYSILGALLAIGGVVILGFFRSTE